MLAALLACLLATLPLAGCSVSELLGEEDCGQFTELQRTFGLPEATRGANSRSWELVVHDACGHRHHNAAFSVPLQYATAGEACRGEDVQAVGKAYTSPGLMPYTGTSDFYERGEYDVIEGHITDIGYGQQADLDEPKPLSLWVTVSLPPSDTSEGCLDAFLDEVELHLNYHKAKVKSG